MDTTRDLRAIWLLAKTYLLVAGATLLVLVVLSNAAPGQASPEAWGHAIIVAVFAVLLPMRLRSAERGSVRALRAVGLIAAVLCVVNVVEACLPGFVPTWMRLEMVAIALLMAAAVGLVVRERVAGP